MEQIFLLLTLPSITNFGDIFCSCESQLHHTILGKAKWWKHLSDYFSKTQLPETFYLKYCWNVFVVVCLPACLFIYLFVYLLVESGSINYWWRWLLNPNSFYVFSITAFVSPMNLLTCLAKLRLSWFFLLKCIFESTGWSVDQSAGEGKVESDRAHFSLILCVYFSKLEYMWVLIKKQCFEMFQLALSLSVPFPWPQWILLNQS